MLNALADHGHERHTELCDWAGEDLDPKDSSKDELHRNVAAFTTLAEMIGG